MQKLKIIISLLLLYSTVNSYAQKQTITLPQAIKIALDSNLYMRSANYNIEAQKALKSSAWDIDKTSVEVEYGQMNSVEKDNSITVSQGFAFPTVYAYQNKLAAAKVKGSEHEKQSTERQITGQVQQVYCELSYLYSKMRLLQYQDSLLAGFVRAADLRLKAGETNGLELITARSQRMEVSNMLRQARLEMSTQYRQLQQLLNTSKELQIADTALVQFDFLPKEKIDLSANPNLKQIQQQADIAALEQKLERNRLLPDLSIGYFNQTMIGNENPNNSSGRYSGIKAGIAIPIWFAPQTAKIKAARINRDKAQNDAQAYAKSLENQYNALMDEYRGKLENLNYYKQQALPEANLIIEHASKAYRSGSLDYQDYVINLNRSLTIKQSYLDALLDYNKTVISINSISQ